MTSGPSTIPGKGDSQSIPSMPRWGWVVLLCLACFEPAAHLYLVHGLPGHLAHSGLHIGDDSFFLPAMEMFRTGFHSPFATCRHPGGYEDHIFFTVPLSWLLGIVSFVPAALGADLFLLLGFINGGAMLAYGLGAWAFLRRAMPGQAHRAYLLFLLGGGLGGVLYLVSWAGGWNTAPGFEVAFHRYARYELIEGPFMQPWVLLYRAYYLVPLALGWFAFSVFVRREATWPVRLLGWGAFLLASFVNARVTPFLWVGMGCHTAIAASGWATWRRLGVYALAPVIGMAYTMTHMGMNPQSLENCFELLRRSAWFGSVVSAVFFPLCFALLLAPAAPRAMPPLMRLGAWMSYGYLAAFALGYALYQTYYGNWLGRGDAAAAIAVSDPALAGAGLGAAVGCWQWRRPARPMAGAWLCLWIGLVLCASISAFWGGAYLRFMPERGIAVLGPPLALAAALGLGRLGRPRVERALLCVAVACGACSACVSMLLFHLPLGYQPGQGPFVWNHHEVITPNEAQVIGAIAGGEVVAPASEAPLYSDFIVHLRPEATTPYGQSTFNLSAQSMSGMAAAVGDFYAPGTSPGERAAFLRAWCVDYVFCPEVHPVHPETLAAFDANPALELVSQAGECRLYAVRKEKLPTAPEQQMEGVDSTSPF